MKECHLFPIIDIHSYQKMYQMLVRVMTELCKISLASHVFMHTYTYTKTQCSDNRWDHHINWWKHIYLKKVSWIISRSVKLQVHSFLRSSSKVFDYLDKALETNITKVLLSTTVYKHMLFEFKCIPSTVSEPAAAIITALLEKQLNYFSLYTCSFHSPYFLKRTLKMSSL